LRWATEQLVGLVFWNNRTLASFEKWHVSAFVTTLARKPVLTVPRNDTKRYLRKKILKLGS